MVQLVDFALCIAVLSGEVVELPRRTVFLQGGTFLEVCVPLSTIGTRRNHALSGLVVEMRSLGETLASVVSFEVGMVDFALVQALLGGKVVDLPFLTSLLKGRTFDQFRIPLGSIRAHRFNTRSCLVIKQRFLCSARARIIFFDVSMIDLTF